MNEVVYIIFILINLFLFKNLSNITKKINFYDIPDNFRKIHNHKVSKIGGLLLYLNILIYFSFFLEEKNIQNIYLLIFLSILFLVSLINDKKDINPNYRLIIFYLIFLIWIFFDERLIVKNLYFDFLNINLSLGNYGYLITPLFFVIFANALNLFDGVNLQSSTYFFFFFIFFYLNEIDISNYLYLIIFIIFFSYFNLKNKIFLGDGGITIFAVIITYIIIKNYNIGNENLNCERIFAMMFLPGIDMVRLYFYRLYKKRNPFSADQNHLHHYIMKIIPSNYVFLYHIIFNTISMILIYVIEYNILIVLILMILIYFLTFLMINAKKKL